MLDDQCVWIDLEDEFQSSVVLKLVLEDGFQTSQNVK